MSSLTTRDIEKLREQARLVRAQVKKEEAAKSVIRKEIKELEEELKTPPLTRERAKILNEEIKKFRDVLWADKLAEFPLGKGGRKTRRRRKTRKTRKNNKFRV
jgi:hypothetical protein